MQSGRRFHRGIEVAFLFSVSHLPMVVPCCQQEVAQSEVNTDSETSPTDLLISPTLNNTDHMQMPIHSGAPEAGGGATC